MAATVANKPNYMKKIIRLNLMALALFAWTGGVSLAQSTAFTYQGRLDDSGAVANGSYDLSFAAYDATVNGNLISPIVTNSAVTVSNGLFTTTVDFGSGVFTGTNLWLEIAVSTNAADTFSVIAPRQQFSPTPYALYSQSALFAQTAGAANTLASSTVSVPQLNTVAAPASGQVLAYNGTQLVWQDPVIGGNTGGWSLNGNSGTTPGADFLGTTDSKALEFKVGNVRGLRIEPTGSSYPNVIGGGPSNLASNAVTGAAIGGGINNVAGGQQTFVGGGYQNHATGYISAIAGGAYNVANSDEAFVGAGAYNTAGYYSVVGGGSQNSANGNLSTVVGGYANVASGNDSWFLFNPDFSSAGNGIGEATVGGGFGNTASSSGATVPGGLGNTAAGIGSFAAGSLAKANNNGTFVWSDYAFAAGQFSSLTDNQFLIRAAGGVGIGTAKTPPGGLRVDSGGLAVTGGSSPNYPGASGVFIEKSAGVGAMFAFNYNAGGGPLSLCLNSPGGNVGVVQWVRIVNVIATQGADDVTVIKLVF